MVSRRGKIAGWFVSDQFDEVSGEFVEGEDIFEIDKGADLACFVVADNQLEVGLISG